MRRRTIIKSSALFALGTLSAAAMGGCSSRTASESGTEAAPSGAPLKVGMVPWLGWGNVRIAEVKGFFAEEGVNVEQIVFQTVGEVNTAFIAGKTDLAWLVASDMIVLSEQAPDIKFIMACDYSGAVDAIVGNSSIDSAEAAKGKKFAREDVPYEIVFMGTYLKSLGLSEADVEILPLPASDGAAALIAGNVDAAAVYEPFVSSALKEGKDVEVLFSAEGTNIIINGVAGHSEALTNRREDILAYLRAVVRAETFAKENPDEANTIIAEWVGITPEENAELMSKIELIDLEKNKTLAFDAGNSLNVASSIDAAAPILVDAGKVTKAAEGSAFVDDSFVKAL